MNNSSCRLAIYKGEIRTTLPLGWREYTYFGGQMLAEKDQAGVWTDYIYAGGKKIAMAPHQENVLQVTGSYSGPWTGFGINLPAPAMQNYVFRPGDVLNVRQRKFGTNVHGGVLIFGNNIGSVFYDQDGQRADDDTLGSGIWHNRRIPLDGLSGTTFTGMAFGEGATTNYTFQCASISVSSADGTVRTIYNGSSTDNQVVPAASDVNAIRYFASDHLGTAQMELSQSGLPLWQGEFAPFWAGTRHHPTQNRYKFTGKERDAESGLDYFGARYYASSVGRFMSPDWAAKAEPVPYARLDNPQSLNLYSYVGNNPLRSIDPDGHFGLHQEGATQCVGTSTTCSTGTGIASTQIGSTPSANAAGAGINRSLQKSPFHCICARPPSVLDKVGDLVNKNRATQLALNLYQAHINRQLIRDARMVHDMSFDAMVLLVQNGDPDGNKYQVAADMYTQSGIDLYRLGAGTAVNLNEAANAIPSRGETGERAGKAIGGGMETGKGAIEDLLKKSMGIE